MGLEPTPFVRPAASDYHRSSMADHELPRRRFLQTSSGALIAAGLGSEAKAGSGPDTKSALVIDNFNRPDAMESGDMWESLNPGYWQLKSHALRRRLRNYGDRARDTGFPFHYQSHRIADGVMPVDYDPSLPHGCIYRRDWRLKGNYRIEIDLQKHSTKHDRRPSDHPDWKMFQSGYGQMGIVLGARTLFDSYGIADQAWRGVWSDNDQLQIIPPKEERKKNVQNSTLGPLPLKDGARSSLIFEVSGNDSQKATLTLSIVQGNHTRSIQREVDRKEIEGEFGGYFGITGQGNLDFSVTEVRLSPGSNQPLNIRLNECHNCYALGPTLRQENGHWKVRFVAMFRNTGNEASIRIADQEHPSGGWSKIPIAGRAKIVRNNFRVNTAVIEATLPAPPNEKTLYYTVWKDGINVTADPRLGSDAVGPGSGFVGDVPDANNGSGNYVGRLPKLTAPYRFAGLSCHAIHYGVADPSNKNRPSGKDGSFYVRDQPTYEAYKHFNDYQLQTLLWEDDVWYLELLIYPPSPDDAYQIVNTTISGPTSRWQLMRHWNVINPGDHDYGMDDVKGPEQLVVRRHDGLGQDRDYMRRNFQMVQHLISGDEQVDPLDNPKKWTRWKMPNRDFSLYVLDSRLWRSSQYTELWDRQGWKSHDHLYDRRDPTRSLLGEEQFAWLEKNIRSDASPLICLTGINGLHTIWEGGRKYSHTDKAFDTGDRVAADYAGWVTAGVDRILQLLGCREGIVSVYGDVHVGSIMKNKEHGLLECSFGPIGRSGGRAPKQDFGPRMKDFDGRDLELIALYHDKYHSPRKTKATGPYNWNFLEMVFDPRDTTSSNSIQLRLRNLIDAPAQKIRGGGQVTSAVDGTGRKITSKLPELRTLANADVVLSTVEGTPIRAIRSNSNGQLILPGLTDIPSETRIICTAFDGQRSHSQVLKTLSL